MREVLHAEADLSTDDLFRRVLDGDDVDDATFLSALVALHERPTQKVVDRSLALCASTDPTERCIGLRALRELKHPYTDRGRRWAPIERTVLGLATTDDDPTVLACAISCLGYQATSPEALAAVLRHLDHPDENVRFTVAAALPALAGEEDPDPVAVAALTRLTADLDPDVRSYAIMGLADDLGLAVEIDAVIRAHVSDPDDQIRDYCRRVLEGDEPRSQ